MTDPNDPAGPGAGGIRRALPFVGLGLAVVAIGVVASAWLSARDDAETATSRAEAAAELAAEAAAARDSAEEDLGDAEVRIDALETELNAASDEVDALQDRVSELSNDRARSGDDAAASAEVGRLAVEAAERLQDCLELLRGLAQDGSATAPSSERVAESEVVCGEAAALSDSFAAAVGPADPPGG